MKRKNMSPLALCLALVPGIAAAQQPVHVILPEKDTVVERYADGSVESLPSETLWRYMCGSDTTGLTQDDLLAIAQSHAQLVAGGVTTINNSNNRGGLDVIFNVSGGLPAGAAAALALAETAIESTFNDPTTVVVSLSFANLGGGVLGATGSNYVTETWANSRTGLVNGQDGDDSIQDFLPTGTVIPVRYDEASATITNENRVFWTRANYKSTVGSLAGTDATMQYNSAFSWDYDPSNGVSGSSYSFVDVVIHEVGHAMGFTSGSDFRSLDMETLDVFRFQRTDGTGDYNPDTTAEFQTAPRTVDLVNTDNQNSDLISAEYRMSDGSPYQTSHFREQSANIGIMDPAFGNGLTYISRGYFADSDRNMFDAMGYDRVVGNPPSIVDEPDSTTVCQGQTAQLIVVAAGDPTLTYQWFDIFLDPVPGATSATLSFVSAQPSNAGIYFCRVTNGIGTIDSALATITVNQGPSISDQPDTQTINEGDNVTFTVVASGTPTPTFQWRKDTVNIGGATSSSYTITGAIPDDDGNYDVVVTNSCGSTTSNDAILTVTPDSVDCVADTNGDGSLTAADFSAWVAAFNAQAPACDQNNDALCTASDFSAWIANYNAGCP